jgi:hypothetical protein
MTAGDAAEEFPPQKTGPRNPTFILFETTNKLAKLTSNPIGDRESYQRAKPPLEREHGEMTTATPPPEDASAISAERTGKNLDDDL